MLVAGVLTLSLALPTAAAEAATRSVKDGPDGYRLPPAENLTRVTYGNDPDSFRATLRVKDLNRKRTQSVGFNLHFGPDARAVDVFVTRFRDGTIRNWVGVSADRNEPSDAVPCATLTADWLAKGDRIEIVVPWTCLAELRTTVKVDAFFSMNDGTHGDPSDFVRPVQVQYG